MLPFLIFENFRTKVCKMVDYVKEYSFCNMGEYMDENVFFFQSSFFQSSVLGDGRFFAQKFAIWVVTWTNIYIFNRYFEKADFVNR